MTIFKKRRECFLRMGKSVKKKIYFIFLEIKRGKNGKKGAHPVISTYFLKSQTFMIPIPNCQTIIIPYLNFFMPK